METILVSACLLGVPCRWHGRAVPPSWSTRRYLADHPGRRVVLVCPEMLGGLPTPRPPSKRVGGRMFETCAEKANRRNVTGAEVTGAFAAGAKATLAIARRWRCRTAILCARSPSCAKTGVTGSLLSAHGVEVLNFQ